MARDGEVPDLARLGRVGVVPDAAVEVALIGALEDRHLEVLAERRDAQQRDRLPGNLRSAVPTWPVRWCQPASSPRSLAEPSASHFVRSSVLLVDEGALGDDVGPEVLEPDPPEQTDAGQQQHDADHGQHRAPAPVLLRRPRRPDGCRRGAPVGWSTDPLTRDILPGCDTQFWCTSPEPAAT